jgi:hypothetical protein
MHSLIRLFLLGSLSAVIGCSQPYIISTVAGTDRLLDGNPAINVPLRDPQAVKIDPAGNLYIADSLDSRIRKINQSGIIGTIAGNGFIAERQRMHNYPIQRAWRSTRVETYTSPIREIFGFAVSLPMGLLTPSPAPVRRAFPETMDPRYPQNSVPMHLLLTARAMFISRTSALEFERSTTSPES